MSRLNPPCATCTLGPDCHNRRPGFGEYCGLMHRPDVRAFVEGRTSRPDPQLAAFQLELTGRPADDGRIRIGLVARACFDGGAENWMLSLARSLDPARFRVAGLVVLHGRGASSPGMVDRFRAAMPVGFGRRAGLALAAACDLVVGWDAGDFPAELASRGVPRPKVVLVSHSPAESGWARAAMARLDGVDAIAAVSEPARETVPADRRAETRVIWNAADDTRLRPSRPRDEVRASWRVGPADLVVGYYGRLSPEKGPDVLPGLAAALPPPWRVVAVGWGESRAGLAADAPANLHLVGPDHAAGDVLGAFDLLVNPSHHESFGLSMAEAMHRGLPVLATPAGLGALAPDCVRVVPHGTDGPGWARAVLADRADIARTRERIARAREFASTRLSLARFGAEWSDYLAGLVAPRRAARDRAAMDPTRLAMLAETCPAGSGPCGCGTGPPRECARPDRPPLVRKADCLECSARRWWASGVEAGW